MHIEINAGGLGAGIAVAEYQVNMADFILDTESVISSFKAVTKQTYGLSGGVGNLQDAVDEISARVRQEEDRQEAAATIRKKSNDFLDLAIRVDKQVSTLVNKNKDAFYEVNPWLKPPVPEEEKPLYEQAWSWLCDTGEAIKDAVVEGVSTAWQWTKDTAKKAWDGLVEFYEENKKVIDTVLLVVGAIAAVAAVVASGGGALIPLLTALGCSAGTAVAISGAVAVVAVVSTVASTTLNVVDLWAEIDNPTFNAWQNGLNFVSGVSNFAYSIGSIYNSFHKISPAQTKQMMKNAFSNSRGGEMLGYKYPYLSDAQPGADSAINRELLTDQTRNHFYSYDNPNGGKVIVSADRCDKSGVARLDINPNEEYVVLTGTHGNKVGGLSFEGPPDPLDFFDEDCKTFRYFKNVKVINIQDHVASLNEAGRIATCNRPYLESIMRSGKNIICAWCYSDRSILVHELLGLM